MRRPGAARGISDIESTRSFVLLYHPCIADVIVQSAFLAVKADHQISDVTDHSAQHFSKTAAGCPPIANPCSVCRHDLQFAQHFSRRCAVFSKEETFVRNPAEDEQYL